MVSLAVICMYRMRPSFVLLYSSTTVGVIAAITAVSVGMCLRERGCHCSSLDTKRKNCCYKDMTGDLCSGQCVCKKINDYRSHPYKCHSEIYELKGASATITAISVGVSGISFILAIALAVMIHLWCRESPVLPVVHVPHKPVPQGHLIHPKSAHLLKGEPVRAKERM